MSRRFTVAPDLLAQGGEVLTLTGPEAQHMFRVLRLRPGDRVELVDGQGHGAVAEILEADRRAVRLAVRETFTRPDDRLPVELAVAVIKGGRMDWLVQKATELGAAAIRPFVSRRCVAGEGEPRDAKRLSRWREIASQSLKQCRGDMAPRIESCCSLPELLSGLPAEGGRILLWEAEARTPLLRAWAALDFVTPIMVLVGPEGGFEEDEVAACRAAGFLPATLGRRILRAETASIAAVAALAASLWARRLETA